MATLLKVLNNLADTKSAGVLRFASELRGSYPSERISFVHRRFNEYFLARAVEIGLTDVDLESITSDRRDRDALVLYVELASDEKARELAQFCWDQIEVIGETG